ncbi:MAG: hypothetical protein QM727_03145 [Niabella sp.]
MRTSHKTGKNPIFVADKIYLYPYRSILVILFVTLFFLETKGQAPASPNTTVRHKTIRVQEGPVLLDSLSILPSSFSIVGVDSNFYRLDYVNAMLYWRQKPAPETVEVSYRVFPFKLNARAQRMDFDSLILNSAIPVARSGGDENLERNLFNFGNIMAQGSFGRQIGFGNNQSAVLNSNMNIQLSGFLADSIELQAAITDNNVPIQPEGNTLQLNDFDEVYIRFKKDKWQLNIGDMDIRETGSYFLNFYKRMQGMSFETTQKIGKNNTSRTFVSGSMAKGKFTRNAFDGLEGNQGPYRLTGANNELFFIVLANTERVYLDGELLQRGEDQDYVINYNTAELTFTPKRMITKYSRIQVEFEYADRNFLNTNIFASQSLTFGEKLKLNFSYFNNSDAKNSSVNQVLDPKQKHFLSTIGDNISGAYYPSISVDTFAAGKILYEKVYTYDTLGVVVDSFYQYSTDATKTLYNLGFTQVGRGAGDYVADNNNANGKVFSYVAPIDGVRQGDYEPVTLLITPKRQQVMSLGLDYNISKSTLFKAEVAASNYDMNTLSSLQDNDNTGYAAKFNLTNNKLLKEKNELTLTSAIDYEFVQDKFKPIERLRNVEFTRDWGLPLTSAATVAETEHIIKASTGLKTKSGNQLRYRFTSYSQGSDYNGIQNYLQQFSNWGSFSFNNEVVLTQYHADSYKGHFLRPTFNISKAFPQIDNWRIGVQYAMEHNENRDRATDSLTPSSFSFDSYTVYLKSDENKRNKYGVNFFTREDKYVGRDRFEKGDRSYNLNLQAELLGNAKRQFYLNATLRKLKVSDHALSPQKDENSILTRMEYVMNEWKGFLTGNILYEAGSGQEQKREFAYLEVPAGTGQYTWIDYNGDGVQQLNEFELAAFQDQGKFIRILTPTNEYIKANYTTLNYSLGVNPQQLWQQKDQNKAQKFLTRFNLSSSLQITQKTLAKNDFAFNPFSRSISDSSLITLSTTLVNVLSFNRASTKWGFDLSNTRNSGKSLLTYGYESREASNWTVKFRQNLSKSFTLNINGISGLTALYTENNQFANKNYKVSLYSVEPLLTFINGTNFRLTSGYKFESKSNLAIYGGEKVTGNSLQAETKYNLLQSSAVAAKFEFENLRYKSAAAGESTVRYIMLDGLMPGKNFIWNITLTKRLMNNLELNFQYDGRKPGSTKTVHTGRATLTALF